MRGTGIAGVCVATVLVAACSPAAAPGTGGTATVDEPALTDLIEHRPAPAPQRRIHPVLQGALQAAVDLGDRPAAEGPVLSYLVADDRGYPLIAHDADRPVLPASTSKLVTAAAALRSLGPDHRYVTEVRAAAHPGASGLLDGDVVLVGGGDPALATPGYGRDVYPVRPRTPLEDLADQIADAGVREITGSIVADASVFADEPLAPGWQTNYLADLDSTPVSGLTVDAGRILEWKDDGRVLATAADDPAVHAATLLGQLLDERGIATSGTVRRGTRTPSDRALLASVASPPLRHLLRHAVQRSDNHMSDGIHRTLGADRGGTWGAAASAARDALADLELDWRGVVLADGSGLSRDARLTASFLVGLDLAMGSGPDAAVWNELMAVAGRSGTLTRRLRGTSAAGALRGKTGALTDVRSFAGSVHGPDGRRYHLAVLANGVAGSERGVVRDLVDRIAVLLADDLRCGTVAPPADAVDPPDPGTGDVAAAVEDGAGTVAQPDDARTTSPACA